MPSLRYAVFGSRLDDRGTGAPPVHLGEDARRSIVLSLRHAASLQENRRRFHGPCAENQLFLAVRQRRRRLEFSTTAADLNY